MEIRIIGRAVEWGGCEASREARTDPWGSAGGWPALSRSNGQARRETPSHDSLMLLSQRLLIAGNQNAYLVKLKHYSLPVLPRRGSVPASTKVVASVERG